MITLNQYRRACYIIDRYSADRLLADFMWPPGTRGRRPALSARTFLIGCLLTIEDRRTMRYKDVFTTLVYRLPLRVRIELGTWETFQQPDGRALARRVLEPHHLYAFTERLRNRCGGGRHGDAIQAADKDALLAVVNAIIRATHPTRPSGSSAYTVDESGVWAWSRARKKTKDDQKRDPGEYDEDDRSTDAIPRSIDPDATWGGKTSKNGPAEMFFGYSLHGIVRAPAKKADYDSEPFILEAVDLTPASTDLVNTTLGMLDGIVAAGQPVTEVIGDRHYSYKRPERWAQELVKRGIHQVLDLHTNDQGFTDAAGTRVAAGVPHCPATPDHLGDLPRPGPKNKGSKSTINAEDKKERAVHAQKMAAFRKLIAEREQYALARKDKSASKTEPGYRWICPAVAGKVGCPLRPGTVEAAREIGAPVVENPPDPRHAPSACSAKSVTISLDDAQPKLHQKDYWGSEEWEKSFARRNHVESFFGSLKDAAGANMKRDSYRGDSLGLRLLYVGLCCAMTNLHRLSTWHEETGRALDLPDELLARMDPPDEVLFDEAWPDAA